MGRLELVVLGLACCLAAASAAKVSERPAEGAGAAQSSLSQIWKLGTGHGGGKADGQSPRQKEPA